MNTNDYQNRLKAFIESIPYIERSIERGTITPDYPFAELPIKKQKCSYGKIPVRQEYCAVKVNGNIWK